MATGCCYDNVTIATHVHVHVNAYYFIFYLSRAWFRVVEVPDDADYVFGEEGFLGTSSPHI